MFQQYLRKMNFQQNLNGGQNGDHLKKFAEYNDITKTRGGPMAAPTPFSQAKMYFTSKRIWCKKALKNIYNLLANYSMQQILIN